MTISYKVKAIDNCQMKQNVFLPFITFTARLKRYDLNEKLF
jgi:hypothetical protein